MKLKIIVVAFLLLLSGCAVKTHPPVDWISFGKKCMETYKGTIVSSYVWFYNRRQGLEATKEECNIND
jgi:hypothetical protein|tara:strand:+ start:6965 stop:7168 length:204 start_codon:yes stop_codon:yes gene_type:complete